MGEEPDREAAAGPAAVEAEAAAPEQAGAVRGEEAAVWAVPVRAPARAGTACARTAGRRRPTRPACPVTR